MSKPAVEIEGLEDLIGRLRALPVELASTRGGPIRTALRKTMKAEIQKPLEARVRAVRDTGQLEEGIKIKIVEARRRDRAMMNASNYEAYNVGVIDKYVQNNETGKQEPIGPRAYVSEFGGKVPSGDPMNGESSYRPARKWFRRGLRADQNRAVLRFVSELAVAIERAAAKLRTRKY